MAAKDGGGVLVGDALLELAKAKELANVMGGAWHDASDSDDEPSVPRTAAAANGTTSQSRGNKGGGLFAPLRRSVSAHSPGRMPADSNANSVVARDLNDGKRNGSLSNSYSGYGRHNRRGAGGYARRPADGKAPGRRDPVAVAKAEAAAKLATERERDDAGVDPSWRLPTNVDYYADRAALLRELVKEMPAEKRLSFQTRVANARTKEAIESVLQDFAPKLECLILPHARSREVDLQQVKKDTARERVMLDGKEIVFWDSPSDHPYSWHEELWATVENRVMEGLLRGCKHVKERGETSEDGEVKREEEEIVIDKARALASKEWNKARAVATTSEVFKAMSRTGAGGDAYFALVALFCTADKMVVPVHCQESPVTIEFHQPKDTGSNKSNKARGLFGSKAGSGSKGSFHGSPSSGGGSREGSRHGRGGGWTGGGKGGDEDVHVVVTVPSTFDIYLRDGRPQMSTVVPAGRSYVGGGTGGVSGGGSHYDGLRQGGGKVSSSASSNGYGGRHHFRGNDGLGPGVARSSDGNHGGADASAAVHLVRVRAVVEEEIRVVGSTKLPAPSEINRGGKGGAGGFTTAPTLRFLLEHNPRDWTRTSYSNVLDSRRLGAANRLSGQRASSAPPAMTDSVNAAGGVRLRGPQTSSSSTTKEPEGDWYSDHSPASVSTPPPAAPVPLLTLTRTERRMRVSVVPEPSAVSEMMRSFSRKIGVHAGNAPEPPRILGF